MKVKTKKLLSIIISAAMLLSIVGCADDSGGADTRRAGLSISVEESTGKMNIERPVIENPRPMGKKGTWTIFVYMCGSDLESGLFLGGNASDDINEMCKATSSDKVKFVIETGGSSFWHNDNIDSEENGRFVIEKGRLKRVGKTKATDMGKSKTLTGFLSWGLKKYPAENMGVIFWDHGGGSIAGVCFDELKNNDSLSLREIDAAMISLLDKGQLKDTFEFIGFDACLMGTVETANIAASYADHMIASEESEPGNGWDYTAIGNFLAKKPGADGSALGKVVCDSFKKQCEKSGDGKIVTMSVIDLSKMDKLISDFNTFARGMYENSEKKDVLTQMMREITQVDNFGGNNKADGYSNMVDLGGLVNACSRYSDKASEFSDTLKQAVEYKIAGSDHKKASGMSVFYPLGVEVAEEMNVFESVCVSPYYMSFIGRQGYGSANNGDTEDYDDEIFYDEDGIWSFMDEFLYDEESGDYDYDTPDSGNWEDFDESGESSASELITFEQEPGLEEDGTFSFVLDDAGYENTSDILALVYQEMEDGTAVELGETYDVNVDWDTGYVSDNFDGYWLSLPDGQNLATYIASVTDDYIIYASPILLNGEETCLRIRQYTEDGSVEVEGAWDGIDDDCGAAAKNIIKLKKGDEITPTYYSIDEKGADSDEYQGDSFKLKNKHLKINYDTMYEGRYSYAFCITDVYGDDFITDTEEFRINENGEITF